jgi:hypothetical protein
MHERTVGKLLAGLGYVRLSTRPQHPESDPEAQEDPKKASPSALAMSLPASAEGKPVEVWFQDEARVGQQGTRTRIWAKCQTAPEWDPV